MTPPAMSAGSPFALSLSSRAPRLRAIVPANLLKTSRNLLVISDSCRSVAEKLLLGLRMDAIRSQLARNRPPTERPLSEARRRPLGVQAPPPHESAPPPQVHLRREPTSAPAPRPFFLREVGHAWRAIWARGRACSGVLADRTRKGPWLDSGKARQRRQRAPSFCGQQASWSLS